MNISVAQIFRRQAQLKSGTESKLKGLVPGLTEELLVEMRKPPISSFDPAIIQEPHVYRITEVFGRYGDGIMSAIDSHLPSTKLKEAKVKIVFS